MKRFSIKTLLLLTFAFALGICCWNYRLESLRKFYLSEPDDVCFHYQTESSGRPRMEKIKDAEHLIDIDPNEDKLVMLYVDTGIRNGNGDYTGSGVNVFMEIHRNDLGRLFVTKAWDNHLDWQRWGYDVRLLWTAENTSPSELQFNYAIHLSYGETIVDVKSGIVKMRLNRQANADAG